MNSSDSPLKPERDKLSAAIIKAEDADAIGAVAAPVAASPPASLTDAPSSPKRPSPEAIEMAARIMAKQAFLLAQAKSEAIRQGSAPKAPSQ